MKEPGREISSAILMAPMLISGQSPPPCQSLVLMMRVYTQLFPSKNSLLDAHTYTLNRLYSPECVCATSSLTGTKIRIRLNDFLDLIKMVHPFEALVRRKLEIYWIAIAHKYTCGHLYIELLQLSLELLWICGYSNRPNLWRRKKENKQQTHFC